MSSYDRNKLDYVTTNKSDRNINVQFDQRQFNTMFEANEEKIQQEKKAEQTGFKSDEIIQKKLPHQQTVEDNIIMMREVFYKVIDMLMDKKNPIPYILSTPERHFSSAILLLILGTLLLLLSNLMISSNK
jgi:hypothetical protein